MRKRASGEAERAVVFTRAERVMFRKFTSEVAHIFGYETPEEMHESMKELVKMQKDLPTVISYCRGQMDEKAAREQRTQDFMAGLFKDGISAREGGKLTRKGLALAVTTLILWVIGGSKLLDWVFGKIIGALT